MRVLDGVPIILNLKEFFRVSFSAASYYSKGTEDPTLPKASDRAMANTLIFPVYVGTLSLERVASAVWYHLR